MQLYAPASGPTLNCTDNSAWLLVQLRQGNHQTDTSGHTVARSGPNQESALPAGTGEAAPQAGAPG